eukprot:TRINITY_DN14590_c0_g1_i1.p1 TRINITY_DN14590_c0_g1~~TRINITY_DN14590_c0_g1_i1.p1  ORF type:complete len:362 (+),score=63.45 TRINITY_DN14590_c0_g1_i1:367-1452(+)
MSSELSEGLEIRIWIMQDKKMGWWHQIKDHRLEREGRGLYDKLMVRISNFVPDVTFFIDDLDEPKVSNMIEGISGTFYTNDEARIQEILNKSCKPEVFDRFKNTHGFFFAPATFAVTVPKDRPFPLFSQSKVEDCFLDITLPSWCFVKDVHQGDMYVNRWEDKTRSKLFWRGTTSGTTISRSVRWRDTHRFKLIEESRKGQHPLWDVGMVGFNGQYSADVASAARIYLGAKRVPFGEHFNYKYLLDIDGNSFSRRFLPFIRSTSLIFRATAFDVFLDDFVRPYEHYIPVSLDFQDIDEKLEYFEKNQDVAKRIAAEAHELGTQFLRLEDMECYMGRLLVEYHSILNDPSYQPPPPERGSNK